MSAEIQCACGDTECPNTIRFTGAREMWVTHDTSRMTPVNGEEKGDLSDMLFYLDANMIVSLIGQLKHQLMRLTEDEQ